MIIYVGNIAYAITTEQLREAFSPFGAVTEVKIIIDKMSGKSKGYGFVEMENEDDAKKAIEGLNNTPLMGRNLKVNNAFRKSEVAADSQKNNV